MAVGFDRARRRCRLATRRRTIVGMLASAAHQRPHVSWTESLQVERGRRAWGPLTHDLLSRGSEDQLPSCVVAAPRRIIVFPRARQCLVQELPVETVDAGLIEMFEQLLRWAQALNALLVERAGSGLRVGCSLPRSGDPAHSMEPSRRSMHHPLCSLPPGKWYHLRCPPPRVVPELTRRES